MLKIIKVGTAYDYAYKANKSDAVNFLIERGYKNTTTPSSSIKVERFQNHSVLADLEFR